MKIKDYILTAWLSILTIGFMAYQPDNSGLFFADNDGSELAINEMGINSTSNELDIDIPSTASPSLNLVQENTNSSAQMGLYTFGSQTYRSNGILAYRGASGTKASPGAATANMAVFQFFGRPYISSGSHINTEFACYTASSFNGTSDYTGELRFRTSEGTAARADRLLITGDNIQIAANTTLTLPRFSSAPSGPIAGDIYHDTGDGETYVYNGSSWEQITP